jgi:hypothetical protein
MLFFISKFGLLWNHMNLFGFFVLCYKVVFFLYEKRTKKGRKVCYQMQQALLYYEVFLKNEMSTAKK